MVERLCIGTATIKELAAPSSMSLPAVMQHLAVLEASGLVSSEKTGRVRTCRIEAASLSLAEQWLDERRTAWSQHFDRLAQFLDDTPEE